MKSEPWRQWYDSLVMTVYLGFILYEVSSAFKRMFREFVAWLKPMPKTYLSKRLERELRELLSD